MSSEEFQIGDVVRIKSGDFRGFSGKIVAVKSNKLKIRLEIFGRSVETQTGSKEVEKSDGSNGIYSSLN